jgi:hypothetical protein
VWLRGSARLNTCPKSYIRGDSWELLHAFNASKSLGFGDIYSLPARVVDAFCVLERLTREEQINGTRTGGLH